MTTESYPIEGKNFTSGQWSTIMRRQHQGVDAGMTLSLSSTSNDATISTGRLNFLGFELVVTSAHVVTLAAATGSPVTYVIGVVYDPADENADPDGPLSIASGVKGSITVPSGGVLWPLWEITRQPSQTLNLASVVSYRTARYSLLFAANGVSDPDPAFAQGGQVLVRRTGLKVLDGGSWFDVKDDTGDQSAGVTNGAGWANNGTKWSVLNGVTFLDVIARRSGAAFTASSTGSLADQTILVLPAAARPKRMWVGGGSISVAGGGSYGCDVRVYPSGTVSLTATAPSLTVASSSDLFLSATYRA